MCATTSQLIKGLFTDLTTKIDIQSQSHLFLFAFTNFHSIIFADAVISKYNTFGQCQ